MKVNGVQLEKVISREQTITLVLYMSENCGSDCDSMERVFYKFARTILIFGTQVRLAQIDCGKENFVCKNVKNVYPTVRAFRNGRKIKDFEVTDKGRSTFF